MEIVNRWLEYAEAHAGPLFAISLATLVGTLLVASLVIVRLPAQYFAEKNRPPPLSRSLPLHLLLMTLKNVLGLALVAAGFLLLFLPGQGLLTLIIGLTIMNYPGKFVIERWLVRRPRVLPALNWLRLRFGRPPFEAP